MANKELTVGTTVMLNSGGPLMTVENPSGAEGRVICVWFDEKGNEKHGAFPPAVLYATDGLPSFG